MTVEEKRERENKRPAVIELKEKRVYEKLKERGGHKQLKVFSRTPYDHDQ